jgi:thiamine-phosphate pyrophosphorylase
MSALALRGYYAILDVTREQDARPVAVSARAEELLAARPCCLQLRAKPLGAGRMRDLARALLPLCGAAGVPFCVNDRLDVALAVGAQVIHVGQEDLPLADVRAVLRALGSPMAVGVSTHDLRQARAAVEAGADYIGFGPLFPTASKERPDPMVGLEGLREVVTAVSVPVVAIGGITRGHLADVVAAGAHAAAVISDIERSQDRTVAARAVAAAFTSGAHA